MLANYDTPEQTRKRLRHFGLLVGGIFVLIGLWQLYREDHETVRVILLSLGGVLMGFGLLAPLHLGRVYAVWMKFAFLLGWVNSRILLSIIFFLIFTPVGIVSRILGRDALDRRIDRETESYWVERSPTQSIQEHCERQY